MEREGVEPPARTPIPCRVRKAQSAQERCGVVTGTVMDHFGTTAWRSSIIHLFFGRPSTEDMKPHRPLCRWFGAASVPQFETVGGVTGRLHYPFAIKCPVTTFRCPSATRAPCDPGALRRIFSAERRTCLQQKQLSPAAIFTCTPTVFVTPATPPHGMFNCPHQYCADPSLGLSPPPSRPCWRPAPILEWGGSQSSVVSGNPFG